MKNLIKILLALVVVALFSVSCQEKEYSLGESSYTISQDQLTFNMTPGSDEWTFNFTASINADPVQHPFAFEIRFGDGAATKDLTGSHEYIVEKGTYTAQLLVFTPNGEVAYQEQVITIVEDNEKIYIDNPASLQFALTGGKENVAGKEWTIGPWTAMRNPDNRGEVWWNYNGPDPAMMNDVMIFTPNSIQPNGGYRYDNGGETFMNESLGNLFPDGDPAGSFITVNYTAPTDATWDITTRDGKTILTIYKGFISYATAPEDLNKTEYEVLEFSPSSIKLVRVSDFPIWCFELTSEEPQEIVDLTGGKDAANGKSWKWRPSDQGAGLIMTRTWTGEVWWTVNDGAAGSEAAYDDILTFWSDGRAKIDNHGDSYLNEATGDLFSDGKTDGSFVTVEYVPANDAKWSFTTVDGVSYLKLTNVFPMYAINPEVLQEGLYEIIEISADLLCIRFIAGTGEWDVTWNYYLVPAE